MELVVAGWNILSTWMFPAGKKETKMRGSHFIPLPGVLPSIGISIQRFPKHGISKVPRQIRKFLKARGPNSCYFGEDFSWAVGSLFHPCQSMGSSHASWKKIPVGQLGRNVVFSASYVSQLTGNFYCEHHLSINEGLSSQPCLAILSTCMGGSHALTWMKERPNCPREILPKITWVGSSSFEKFPNLPRNLWYSMLWKSLDADPNWRQDTWKWDEVGTPHFRFLNNM